MDSTLLAVTVVSLLVALVMSGVVWRLAREAQARSRARVQALSAAASAASRSVSPLQDQPVSRAEPDWDLVPSAVAVNQSRQAPWAPARVSPFGADTVDRRLTDTHDRRPVRSPEPVPAPSRPLAQGDHSFLSGTATQPVSGGRQRGLAIAACVLFLLVSTGGYWSLYGGRTASASSTAAAATPLELVSLRHDRRGSALAITGLVRNPASALGIERVTAIVLLFDRESRFITSARAALDYTALLPGDESPFVVTVDAPQTVTRYRVSFRNDAGVVPHVDRRGQEPIARELP